MIRLFVVFQVLIVFFFCGPVEAQISENDQRLIQTADFTEHTYDPRRPGFMWLGKNAIVRYNPISLTLGGLLYVYQKAISPQLQSRCPYEISCSAFSKASIEEFGIIKGVALSADRLGRCTQFTVIDIQISQFDQNSGAIIDDPDKYRMKRSRDEHDHAH